MPSDFPVRVIEWASAATLILTLLLLLQIIRMRLSFDRRMSHEQQFLKVWRPLMTAVIAGETPAPPRLAFGEEELFLTLWNHLQDSVRGQTRQRLNALAAHCDMVAYAHGLLHQKGLRPRLMALATLGNLADRAAWQDILRLTKESDTILSLAATRALLQIDATAALTELLPQLIEREDWSTAHLGILLTEIGAASSFNLLTEAAQRLAASSTPLKTGQLKRLLHLLEIAPSQEVLPVIRSILTTAKDDEVIAQCLKLLQMPIEREAIYRFLEHPNWIVRVQVARALGRIGTLDDIAPLVKLLSDPVWWIRYRSAQALVVVAHGDIQKLSQLRTSLTDRYAQDMLDMALAEQEWR